MKRHEGFTELQNKFKAVTVIVLDSQPKKEKKPQLILSVLFTFPSI